jgi:hypothetical protein
MPSPERDPWAYERYALARRRRRRRRQQRMLWLLTGVTTAVLVVIAWMISEMAPVPTTASPAALSASARAPSSAGAAIPGVGRATGTARPRASPRASRPRIADDISGLSYRMLSRPWRRGCPPLLQTPMFSWSAGENAVAGHVVIGGSVIEWHANACSGQLQQQFAYAGPSGLETTAMSLVGALDPAYYSGVQHSLTVQDSSAMQVSGDPAWVVRFSVGYADGASQGMTWSSELGAVVVVDRGPSRVPAVFYVSVPENLGTSAVGALIRSLWVTT